VRDFTTHVPPTDLEHLTHPLTASPTLVPRHDRTPTLPSPAPARQNPTTMRAKRTTGGDGMLFRPVQWGTCKVHSAAVSLCPLLQVSQHGLSPTPQCTSSLDALPLDTLPFNVLPFNTLPSMHPPLIHSPSAHSSHSLDIHTHAGCLAQPRCVHTHRTPHAASTHSLNAHTVRRMPSSMCSLNACAHTGPQEAMGSSGPYNWAFARYMIVTTCLPPTDLQCLAPMTTSPALALRHEA
jgi:hypothetical protein